MLGTREREVNVREERINDYAPLRNNEYTNDFSSRGYDNYNYSNSEVRYAQKYENIDFYNRQYDCYANENVFRPIELSDISESNVQQKKKTKSKFNISTKCKVLIGVYAALVVLIIAMLLVNCIPAVSADAAATAPTAEQVMIEQNAVSKVNDSITANGLTKTEGYVYETETNWFDNFCNSVSKWFK